MGWGVVKSALGAISFFGDLSWDQLQANNALVLFGGGFVVLVVLRSVLRRLLGIFLFRLRPLAMFFLSGGLAATPVAGLGGFESVPAWNSVRYAVCDKAVDLDRTLGSLLPVHLSSFVCGR